MTSEELKTQVDRILEWPVYTRSDAEHRLVRARRADLYRQLRSLVDKAERFDRDLTVEEREKFEQLEAEYDLLSSEVPV